MFDVDWSDPNRESVGDRRARKQKKDGKGKESSTDGDSGDQDGNRTSGSVRSSVSSADKQFGFFGGGKHSSTPKKGTASSFIGKPKSAASSSQRAPTIDEQDEGFGAASTIRRVDDEQHQQQQRPLGIPHSRRFSSKYCFLTSWHQHQTTFPILSLKSPHNPFASIPNHQLLLLALAYHPLERLSVHLHSTHKQLLTASASITNHVLQAMQAQHAPAQGGQQS